MSQPADRGGATILRRVDAAARAADDTAFASLRARAVAHAQAASGAVWTDYNLHDPGLTMLEAICFALTDLVYQADLPVADHLCGPDGVIDFERLALLPPQVVLPCRPTTADDWRRVLLDQVHELTDARIRPDAAHPRAGLFELALQRSDEAKASWGDCEDAARTAFRLRRSLAEDVGPVRQLGVERFDLRLHGVVGGPRDPAEIVAEIYEVTAALLAPPPIPRTVIGLIEDEWALEDIFDGPAVERGVLEPPGRMGPDAGRDQTFVLNDLRARLLQIPGLSAVTRLSLVREDGTEETNGLTWGADWAPRLKTPRHASGQPRPGDADVGGIELSRLSARVRISPADVAASYADLRAGRAHERRPDTRGDAGVHLPEGAPRPERAYFSLQNLLPPLYRLGRNRSATEPGLLAALAEGRDGGGSVADAHAVQLKGYLSLFDQIIANAHAQIDNIRGLLAPERALEGSYRRDVLDDASIPDIEALYTPAQRPPSQVAERVYPAYDDAIERRNRAIDFLLSLYGEQHPQNTQRQFLDFLDSVEQAQFLLHNKAEFLAGIGDLTRDRAAGFDYGRKLWGDGERATPAFHRRVALLLGFADPTARRLAVPTALATPKRGAMSIDRGELRHLLPLPWPRQHTQLWRAGARRGRAGPPRAGSGIDAAQWFELGVDRQNYRWRPAGAGGGVLWLGRDAETGAQLGHFDDAEAAADAAQALREHMLALTAACEGFHVVEHVLLRPRTPGARWQADHDALRITLVFPSWTARTRRESFRAFARETVELNCPAHVAPECLWLDIPAMRRFEACLAEWMDVLRAHTPGASADTLDDAARAVRSHLAQHRPSTPDEGP